MGLYEPWKSSEKMESFLKTMPNVMHRSIKRALQSQPLEKSLRLVEMSSALAEVVKNIKGAMENNLIWNY